MMVECLQTETDTTETHAQLEALVVEFVDRLTGKQTIYQMIQLSEEIEKRGGTPKEPLAYKDEYNRADCCLSLKRESLDLRRGP